MPVVGVSRLNVVINASQVELLLRRVHDCLRDHLRIAELRLDMPVFIQRKVDIAMAHQQGPAPKLDKRCLARRRTAGSNGRRGTRPLVVGGRRCQGLLRALAARRLAWGARVRTVAR